MSPTRKERRLQQRIDSKASRRNGRAFSESRRRLLIGGGILIGGVLVGTPVAYYLLSNHQSGDPVFLQLKELDAEIGHDVNKMMDKAPLIGEMAIKYFCQEMGYPRDQFKG